MCYVYNKYRKMSCNMLSSFFLFTAWFDAVRAFECLGLIFILLCIAAELYMDCLSLPSTDRRLVELLALIAGEDCKLPHKCFISSKCPYTFLRFKTVHRVKY